MTAKTDIVDHQEVAAPEDLKTLLEFMRIKSPEINIRQSQLARIIFLFFLLNILLFLVITTGIGSLSLRLKNPVSISDVIYIHEPRAFIVLGVTLVVFFYFARFGYLFLQSLKEVVSTQNVIDRILPHGNYATTRHVREALMQTCRANYIVQTLVVFLYPDKVNDRGEVIEGPLSGSTPGRGMFIKLVMIVTTIAVEWIIAVSQFMMLVVVLAFTNVIVAGFLLCAFALYYGFYFEYAWRAAKRLKWESWINSITIVAALLIIYSMTANIWLLVNYKRSPDVVTCRMTYEKVNEISPPAGILLSFLFKDPSPEQKEAEEKNRDVKPCGLGLTT